MPSGLANKGGFAKNRGKLRGRSAPVARVLRADGTLRLELHDWQLMPRDPDDGAWRAHVGRRVWVRIGLNPFCAVVTAEKPHGLQPAGFLGDAWCPRTCMACRSETLGIGPEREACARCGRRFAQTWNALLAKREAASVEPIRAARPAFGAPDNPTCGSQGIDAEGRCLRCGLEPSDPALLDADAVRCPPGFLRAACT